MIQFTPAINPNKLRMAYNNDVLRFKSDNAFPSSYAEVTFEGVQGVTADVTIRLYPAPDGSFFINLKYYVSSLINTRNFDDNLNTELPDTFLYDYTTGSYLQKTVRVDVYIRGQFQMLVETTSFVLDWIAGVEQLGSYVELPKDKIHLLSPLNKLDALNYHVKYWQGYPFDLSFYNPFDALRFLNTTNIMLAYFDSPSIVSRLFFSDGRTDETLEDILPLVEGYNVIRFYGGVHVGPADKTVLLEKLPYTCGIYLKWLNKYGGYSYWLFENTYSIDRSSKQIGELSRDFDNIENTTGRAIQIGKESQDTYRIVAELINENDRLIVEGIIDSPKIYMFTGQPFARAFYNDWIQVNLKSNSIRIKNSKQKLTNFTFDIELPERFTQTL
jgi:hypothetical protein